jgi:hypothetical protein
MAGFEVFTEGSLPTSAECPGPGAEEAEIPGSQRRSPADRLESAAAAAQTIHCAGGPRQEPQSDRDGPRPELLGFVWAIAVHTEAQFKLTKAA